MTPEDVLGKYAESGAQIKVTEISDSLVIEGSREGLLFLSELIAAQANSLRDGIRLSPSGAGRAWFVKGSTKGIFVQRLGNRNAQ